MSFPHLSHHLPFHSKLMQILPDLDVPTGSDRIFRDSNIVKKYHPRKLPPPKGSRPNRADFAEEGVFIKYGPGVTVGEGQTLWYQYQKCHPNVPFVEVIGWLTYKKNVYLYMRYARGQSYARVHKKVDDKSKKYINQQLAYMIRYCQSKIPTKSGQSSTLKGLQPGRDFYDRVYPFTGVPGFESTGDEITNRSHYEGFSLDPPYKWAHGDLARSNVIVDQAASGLWSVVAIVDAETAGWYPKATEDRDLERLDAGKF